MSQVSPYGRSAAERSQHRQTATLFVTVVSAIFFAATSLSNPDLFRWESGSPQPPDHSPVPVDEKSRKSTVAANELAARIAALQQALPASDTSSELNERLDSVARDLESADLSSEAEAKIHRLLNTLQQQITSLNALSNRPPVNAEGIDEAIASEVRSILLDEQDAIQKAREKAEGAVRLKKERDIRDVRLDLRDNQDKSASLRRQITQTQRQQSEFRAKAARADALQRQMSDVRRWLTPFTASGHMQPNSTHNAYGIERTVDPAPVSLMRLRKLGALEPTMEGIKQLHTFGRYRNADFKDKLPLGAFSPYWEGLIHKPEVLALVKRAQQLLRDHGQAMVEARLLSP